MNYQRELEAAINAGREAAKIIIDIYNTNFDVEIKEDNSPVTKADQLADLAIRRHLGTLFPNYLFLTEEGKDEKARLNADYVWIVDPLDGTKDFVNHDDEFTVCIALSYRGEIVVGVIVVPVTGEVAFATKGNGAYLLLADGSKRKLQVSEKTENITIVTSRYHLKEREVDYHQRNNDLFKHHKTLGSTLKAIAIASGEAEIFFRGGAGTKEWDIAAADIIITEAGGHFVLPNGQKIKYNKEDVNNHHGYFMVNKLENIRL